MRQMKDSDVQWIGQIPDSWEMIPNRYLFIDHSSKVGDQSNKYQLLSLTTTGVKEKDINASGGKVPESYDNYQTVEPGDMIFCLFDLDCSAVFSGLSNYYGMITSAYDVLKPNHIYLDKYYADFWYQYVFSNRYYKIYSKNIRYTITTDMFKSIPTPIPPLEEQQKIGRFLFEKQKQISNLIANQQAQIEKLKEYKQAVITEAVTKGLDKSAPMKDSGVEWIGQIPEDWCVKPIKSLFSFGKGLPITKADLRPSGIKTISYGQVHAKYNKSVFIDEQLYRFVESKYLQTNADSLVKKGDFIFADTSEDIEGSGDFVYIDIDDLVFAGYHSLVLKSLSNFENKYLAYLFMSSLWKRQLWREVYGIKVFSITRSLISKTTVILPTLTKQQVIVNYLDKKCADIDSLISIKQQKIEKLQEYKKSLIYEYVTGKKEVC